MRRFLKETFEIGLNALILLERLNIPVIYFTEYI